MPYRIKLTLTNDSAGHLCLIATKLVPAKYNPNSTSSELASLMPESFDLNPQHPTITVKAAHSKHRREDIQPINRDLVGVLQSWLSDKPAGEPVFAMPDSSNTAKVLKVDMTVAGIDRSTKPRSKN
jgi:hypothetical protein